MGIRGNKILSAIVLVLLLTVTVSIIGVPTVKAEDVKPSAAVFEAFPNPVAVGDTIYIEFDISPDPPSGYHYEWITVTIVNPDESMITLGPFMADSSGGVAMSVVFTDTGTYSAKLNYPGQMMGEDWYLPFLAGPIYFEVVEYVPPVVESVHNLDTGLDYSAIQDAIDALETLSGHTILVDAGRYYENVAVTKSISLIGEDSSTTIIDGRGNTTVFNVTNVDNVEISGFRIQNGDCGFYLLGSSNVTISGNTIIDANTGVFLYQSNDNRVYGNTLIDNDMCIGVWQSSSFNVISGNTITNSGEGIAIVQEANNNTVSENSFTNNGYSGIRIASFSNYNTISRNNITNHEYGVTVGLYSNHTTIYGNTITDNELGIHIADSSDNRILHNNLIDNIYHQLLSESSNILDDGKEGNYWSNYNGTDNDGDGIGDIPYVIDENNQDNYPLIAPIHPFDAGTWEQTQYFVDCISNSTVSDFCFDPTEGAFLRFNVEGESGTSGFCRVTIPKELLQSEGDWIVLVGGASVTPTVNEDTSSTYLYFTYQHSTKTIEIRGTSVIPEFQSWALILFTLTAFAAAAVIYMLKPPKN
jgi:nitrous oxidase accessory protein